IPRPHQCVCGESCQGPPVRRFHPLRRLEGSAAYVIFLNNIFGHVEFLEKARLPFVFELYPGGGFYLNEAESDAHLERVVSSPMFRKVIVTQNVTRDYLLRKKFCEREEIEFIYGVVEASDALSEVPGRRVRYGADKRCLAARGKNHECWKSEERRL